MSRTLLGLFLVGAVNRPRKRKGTNRENPRTIPGQIGKIPEKSGKSQKDEKGRKRKDESRSGNLGAPNLGSAEGICSDFFRFALPVFGNAPISSDLCSDLFRFLPTCSVLFSEQIRTNRETPSSRPLLQIPENPPFETPPFGDRKGATKKLCDKDFAKRSGELSGAICLKTLVLLGDGR